MVRMLPKQTFRKSNTNILIMKIHIGIKKAIINFFTPTVTIFSLTNCNESQGITFAYSSVINDSVNVFIYHKTSFTHQGSESYIAIGKDFCDIYNNESATFAKTLGFAQIDTVISGKIQIATQYKIDFYRHPKEVSFEVRMLRPVDGVKNGLAYAFIKADSCSK
jgi:hypothetical protein